MTRVVAVTKGLGPGGAERLLVEFARVARGAEIELSVLSLLRQKQHLVPDLVSAGVPVRCLDVSRLRDLRWAPRLLQALRATKADIVHVHSPALAPFVRLAAHLRLLGRHRPRVVTTEHNRWSTYHPISRAANACTAFLDDATIAVSEEVRQSIKPASLARRAVTVRHGIDVDRARTHRKQRDALRSEWGFGPEDVVVVTVANYRPQKNYPVLLHACKRATATNPSLRFVVVGQGPGASAVEHLHHELGLGDTMLLLGYRSDAISVMAAADVFTLSSDYEGLPVALMEALALGLAIVCTDVGGVSETIDRSSGRLVRPRDPAALAASLVQVASDPELLAQLRAGSARLGDSFDVHRSAADLKAVYQHVLTGS